MKKYKNLSMGFGIFLSVISCIFTCQLLLKFADTGMSQLVFVMMGIGIQVVQTLTISISAFMLFQGHVNRAMPAIVIYILLLFLSFAGTIGSLSSENKEINDMAIKDSPEYQTYSSQITDLDVQIQFLRETIADCAKRTLLSKCVIPKTEELTVLMEEKTDLQNKILTINPNYSGDEVFRRIGDFLGISSDQAKSIIYLLYSLALDLGSACLLAYSAGLLAIKERDIWGFAMAETEAEKRKLDAHRKKLLSETTQDNIRQSTQDKTERQDKTRQDSNTERQDKPVLSPYRTDTRQDKIAHKIRQDSPVLAQHKIRQETQETQDSLYGTVQEEPTQDKIRQATQDKTVNTATQQDKIRQATQDKPNIGYLPLKQKIDNRQDKPESDVQRYIELLFKFQKTDGSLTGRRKIGDMAGITQSKCDAIHSKLKRAELITVQDKKTFPADGIDTADEMMRRL